MEVRKKVVSLNKNNIVIVGLIIITVFVLGCIDSFLSKSETDSIGTEKIQAVSPTIMFTPGLTQPLAVIPTDSTVPDISKIEINPVEYHNTKLLDYYLNYETLEEKNICGLPGDPAKAGDAGIVIRGTLKNEYDKNYYIFLSAEAYDSKGNLLGRSLDSGPICGMIAPYVRRNETENFELHLKYYDTISKINLRSGSVSEIPPP